MIKIIIAGIMLLLGVTASANEEIKEIIEEHYGYINVADYALSLIHI